MKPDSTFVGSETSAQSVDRVAQSPAPIIEPLRSQITLPAIHAAQLKPETRQPSTSTRPAHFIKRLIRRRWMGWGADIEPLTAIIYEDIVVR